LEGEPVLGVDDPDEEEAVGLQLVEGHVQDFSVVEGVVGNGDTSGGVG